MLVLKKAKQNKPIVLTKRFSKKTIMQILYTFLLIFVVFGVSFVLINIRHLITGQEFRGTCASNNPMLKDELGECSLCGKKGDEVCKMPEIKKA